ncbi:MAG TPA: FAD-dependent oxidoreductase [Acidimicrobiales bacterium]|jgi:FAD dependent oxidoreductase TIGR03364
MFHDAEDALRGQRTVVVGAGVLGTLHAFVALARGATVVHLERDPVPHGATVRNFGLIWVSGRAAGAELDLALRSRALWEELADDVPGVGFRANGSLTLLNDDAEVEVAVRALSREDAKRREFALLSAQETRARNPGLEGAFAASLYCGRDAAVESRLSLGALRTAMLATGRYEYLANRELVGLDDGSVLDHRGVQHSADRVWICLGATLSGFGSELFASAPLRRVRLNMAETHPLGRTLTTSLADADSFRYYPGFQRDAGELLDDQDGLSAQFAVQLLCQQRLHGGLTIGDTHEVDEPGAFATSDAPMDKIMASARSVIGPDVPAIERRWSGVYHQMNGTTDELYYRHDLARGVTAITGAGGRGMTLAPAIAEESFA